MGPRTGPDDMERRKILPLAGLKLLGSPAHSHLLYRLHYPGSVLYINSKRIINRIKYAFEKKICSSRSSLNKKCA
jgi:hypothetical protein